MASPEKRDLENVVEYPAYLEASESVDVHAPVDGTLLGVASYTCDQAKDFREGDHVRKGELLFVVAARSELYSKWVAAEAVRLRAKQRLQELASPGTAAIGPKRETDETTSVTAALRTSEAELEELKSKLECVEVRAPIAGVVGERHWVAGNRVQRDSAQCMTTIVALQSMHVHFELPEQDLLTLLRESTAAKQRSWNQDVAVALQDEQDFALEARIDYIDSRVDPTTGVAKARALIANKSGLLYPGMSVRVKLALSPPRKALLVHSTSIEEDDQGFYLWLVNKEDKLEKRRVQPGQALNGLTVVGVPGNETTMRGVATDDRYVLNVLATFKPGMSVQPRADDSVAGTAGEPAESP